jgi:hypothetical protein
MASLLLPPTHPKFPIPPVLHAICAASTLYTAAVSSPPLPNYAEVALSKLIELHPHTSNLPLTYVYKTRSFSRNIEPEMHVLIHLPKSKLDGPEKP